VSPRLAAGRPPKRVKPAPQRVFGALFLLDRASFPPSLFATEETTLNTTFVVVSLSVVLLFVVLALAREVKLRRALQRLLAKLLSHWRKPNAETSRRVPDSNSAPDDLRGRL